MLSKASPLIAAGLALLLAGCAAASLPAVGGYGRGIDHMPALPPAPLAERVPPRPDPNAYWQPGHWAWNGVRWVWTRGYYVERPKTAAAWIPGHWNDGGDGYTWVSGRWE
jgi:WXXGXW repeat (2 copies)